MADEKINRKNSGHSMTCSGITKKKIRRLKMIQRPSIEPSLFGLSLPSNRSECYTGHTVFKM